MTAIIIDDTLINEVIAVGHYPNAEEAVVNILAGYVQQKKQATIADLLAMPNSPEIDFEPPRFAGFTRVWLIWISRHKRHEFVKGTGTSKNCISTSSVRTVYIKNQLVIRSC